jgi:hypothetical protein
MPSSLCYFGPKHSRFVIKYKVTARMEECVDSSQSTFKPVISKKRIAIKNPITNLRQNLTLSSDKNIRTMFFLKKGNTHVDCKLERDSIYTNEKAVIHCSIDNSHCNKNIRDIKVKIKRQIKCTATSDAGKYEDETYLMTNTYPGVRHGVKEDRRLELDVSAITDLYRRIKRHYKKKKKDLKPEDVAL